MTTATMRNVLLEPFGTPFGVPPFGEIRTEDYLPAFKEAIRRHAAEVAAIASNPEPATFANTIEALERSGEDMKRVRNVFEALNESLSSDAMRETAEAIAPLRIRHGDDILMNGPLFARIRSVHERRASLGLAPEELRLLERTWRDFTRNGAALDDAGKERLRKINEELALLNLRFQNNVLAEENAFALVIDNRADLEGLPDGVIAAAAEAAKARGESGRWVFTLHKPSLIPFLQYSSRRHLREIMFKGYIERGNHDDQYDNKAIASRIAVLRGERARLLGFASHADWVLDDKMAKTPAAAQGLLERIWSRAIQRARGEVEEFRAMIRADGEDFELRPWDWFHYATRVQKAKYELDDEALRPYFRLENVLDGAFMVAGRLWGLRFTERKDLPSYHPEVRVFEVTEADGREVGIFFTDFFPRESKRGGAWMNGFREQSMAGGKRVAPLVANTCNFTRPAGDRPSLLTLEEVNTLFHEFGHALHGLLSNCRYERLSGTNVPTDFVELPSQIMENWATHPEVMPLYAKHWQTGEPIPADLVKRVRAAETFNQGFATVEYLAASFLDLAYHRATDGAAPRVPGFEKQAMEAIGLIPEIVPRYRTTYFQHIFGTSDYSAGYYSYIWAEVLDADAFKAFEEKGVFDAATAKAYRTHILEKGGTEEPMDLYRRFRGAEPSVEPLLERRGLA